MKRRELLIHLLCWSIVLFLPVFLRPNDPWDIRMNHFVRSVGGMLSYIVVFYVNYLWFIPKMLLAHRRRAFILSNVILVVCAVGFNFAWWTFSTDWLNIEPRIRQPNMGFPTWLIFQWVLMLLLVISLSVAVRMSQRWRHLEQVRKEMENSRVEAELSNLRNQLNPHFLLNTLNNIYALIAFDPTKAQNAVEELSKLLRHMLYDNRQNFVPLYKEAAFITNYIELMKIRVTENVTVKNNIDVAPDDSTPIAPLLFISLIENAFKHGISPSGSGYIDISLSQTDGNITCEIHNSNYPKTAKDKSGSGIGLQQVQKRIDLIYPDRYKWERGTCDNEHEYYSKITIYNDTQVRNS